MVLRITLDVNVWVNHYLSLSRGRQGSAAQKLVQTILIGQSRLGPTHSILSHAMLDTLLGVLLRIDLPEWMAEAARNAVEASSLDGFIVVGGGVQAVRDTEDRGVLETAIAGRSDLLVTNNMADFRPGARTNIDAEMIRTDATGKVDVLTLHHARLEHGLVIASVFAAKAWLVDGVRPPSGALERFQEL